MFRFLSKLERDATGATAIEYGLILALIVLAVMGGVSILGGGVNSAWDTMANKVTTAE